MAIARDSNAGGTQGFNLSAHSSTVSYTTSGSNRRLIVCVFLDSRGSAITAKYNSVSMTAGPTLTANSYIVSIFFLDAPATGANNIDIAWTGTAGIGGFGWQNYTGCAQTGTTDATGTGTAGSGTDASVTSLTTVANNCWMFMGASQDGGNTVSAGTNSTSISTAHPSTLAFGVFDNQTNGPIAASTNYQMHATFSGSSPGWDAVAMSFAPVAVASATGAFLLNFM